MLRIWLKCSDSWKDNAPYRRGVLFNDISMAFYKTAVSPLLTYWRYCSLALRHRYDHQLYVITGMMQHPVGLSSLQWRHNGRDGVSDYQPHYCLFNRLFRLRSMKTSKLRVTGLCAGYSPMTRELPSQRASNGENASIWWRHHIVRTLQRENDKGK